MHPADRHLQLPHRADPPSAAGHRHPGDPGGRLSAAPTRDPRAPGDEAVRHHQHHQCPGSVALRHRRLLPPQHQDAAGPAALRQPRQPHQPLQPAANSRPGGKAQWREWQPHPLRVDHFKHINDRFGHDCGDLVLQGIADVIRREVRHSDLAARWGGEEFLVLLPQAQAEVAWGVAERIRQRMIEVTQSLERGPARVTATLAVCEIRDCEAFASALERADRALYRGKQEGRDRVMLAA
ncbi:GGDEF domain-containing protein [Pseudomonas oryzihabitans]|uniref:GGDEF domain-containing protein n=1 Tax=Pseudomonas oryzihabitans TaxID=47885 RepID=UPI00280ADF3C|nr:GGDEF domain-containing protein [Pseudomonas psychrotolerans]